jgi:hypothetical protein
MVLFYVLLAVIILFERFVVENNISRTAALIWFMVVIEIALLMTWQFIVQTVGFLRGNGEVIRSLQVIGSVGTAF